MDRTLTEGGVLNQVPLFDAPLSRFLVQVIIIMGVTRALCIFCKTLNQPQVAMEVIGGILLGPSALGRNTQFTESVFPAKSIEILDLVSTFGLVLYLFVIGLELDPKLLFKNGKVTVMISLCGIALPFGCGAAISPYIYDKLIDPSVNFKAFSVFIGVAMSITAFPVLARVLTETGLLASFAGQMTIGAAAVDDVVAWSLLTLAISLAASTNSVTAAYIFLSVVGFCLALGFFVRPLFHELVRLADRAGSNTLKNNLFAFTIVCVLVSAWITQILGVHAMFGGFVFGLMMPRNGRFSVETAEKIEDVVRSVLLPLYFAKSGLSTNIATINTPEAGLILVLVIFVAVAGKVVGCGGIAKLSGMTWRESGAVGFLMNTRGLVELIVLNIGLQVGILNTTVFTIMVIMALVTTMMTVPAVELIYPMQYRKHIDSIALERVKSQRELLRKASNLSSTKLAVVVDRTEDVPSTMALLYIFSPAFNKEQGLTVTAMHFSEASQTVSEVMAAADSTLAAVIDPALQSLNVFCKVVGAEVDTYSIVGNPRGFGDELARMAQANSSDVIIMPWRPHVFVGDYYDKFLAETLSKTPCTVALLATRAPSDDVDEDSLAPINAFVIRKVCLVLTGADPDGKALDFVSHYSGHKHVTTHVLLAAREGALSVEIKTKLDALLKSGNVTVSHKPMTSVGGLVKALDAIPHDLVVCSFITLKGSSLASGSSTSPRDSRKASPLNLVNGERWEFGTIGNALYSYNRLMGEEGQHVAMVVIHSAATTTLLQEQNAHTIVVKKRTSNRSMDDSTFKGLELDVDADADVDAEVNVVEDVEGLMSPGVMSPGRKFGMGK